MREREEGRVREEGRLRDGGHEGEGIGGIKKGEIQQEL